ncbi:MULTISPECIES: site-specific integrase [unclassified Bacillus (in: firmicutes)]|uniref:tyrosine-type recombinase/integrase n=1 Tax=unclassified Bacillus (in: firmicutes) TaxID=185979 RepID=UPI001BE8CE75|nr:MULTISPECIES: site-specific integrase [unclassified Bacillus (in: firmicutes)]MBT2615292.1 site-specific integrase [Bacillus sp. ISL-78]MBT2628094.1 site-specific integrase [Bacillus sp. ISL-101]
MATFRKLKSGNWQARVSKDGKEFSIGTYRTKKEAEIEAGKVEERIYYGQALNDRNMLFEEVAKEWLYDYKKANVKESTFEQLEVIVRLHILPFFNNKRIMKIRRTEIKRWINELGEKEDGIEKYSYGSRLKYLSVLKSIFHYAVHELEVLEKNPADRLKVPVQDSVANKKETKYYNLDELNKLLEYMKTYKHQRFHEYQLYYMLMYFLSQTGLRISETLALRWSDIEDNKITIERQTRRSENNELLLTTLKNTSSYRTIGLQDELVRELKKFKLKQNELIIGSQKFHKNVDGIIFQNYSGNYLTPSIVRETIQKYCKKAGVEYKGTHGFRHTHAVLLLESGASIKFVSQRLGHKSIKTTADTYLDITEKIEEDELKKFASYTSMKF